MQISSDISEPFKYSWNLFIILIVVVVFIGLYFLFDKFLLSRFLKTLDKAKVPSLRVLYLRKLEGLLNDVTNNRVELRDAYIRLSGIIRNFVKLVSGINITTMSKKEVQSLGNEEVGLLMEEYYPPEFSKYSKGDIVSSINRTMDVIKKWK